MRRLATVERGSPNTASQLGIGAVKCAILAIEVHRVTQQLREF
jgi:hypothetical protein